MSKSSETNTSATDPETEQRAPRKITQGVLAGGATLLGGILLLVALAVICGWIRIDDAGNVDVDNWLILEIFGGAVVSLFAGWICRRVARSLRGPVILATATFTLGVLEAALIMQSTTSGPTWLIVCAPVVAALGILLGGARRTGSSQMLSIQPSITHWNTTLRYATIAIAFASIAALSLFALPEVQAGQEATLFASALALDFTLTIPALVYVVLVRTRRLPWSVLAPTFVLGYAAAALTIPQQYHSVLDTIRWLAVPAEIALVVYLAALARRTFAGTLHGAEDVATNLRSAARKALGSRIAADIMTTEITMFYYAFHRRITPIVDQRSFTVHREAGYLGVLIGLMMAIIVETVALHVLVSQWSALAAWILTGLSVYGGVWLLGDYRAMTVRPIRITSTHLYLRFGMRWEADIPLERIAEVEQGKVTADKSSQDVLQAVVLGEPNVRLLLREPVEVIGMYGIRKSVRAIRLRVDSSHKLCAELREYCTADGMRSE